MNSINHDWIYLDVLLQF